MNRYIIIPILLFCLHVGAEVNSDSVSYSKGFMALKANQGWFVGANVGGQIYIGAEDYLAPFGQRITPIFSVYGGKWILPYLGIRVGYSGGHTNGFSKNQTVYSTGDMVNGLYKNKYGLNNVHFDLMFNVSERVCRENTKRIYSFIPYAGFGFIQMYKPGENKKLFNGKDNDYAVNVGLFNRFRIIENLSANVDLQAMLLRYGMNRVPGMGSFGIFDVIPTLKVGLTYHFGKAQSRRGYDVGYVETLSSDLKKVKARKRDIESTLPKKDAQIKSQEEEIAKLKGTVTSLSNEIANKKSTEKLIDVRFALFFGSTSSTLTAKSVVALRYAADAIKAAPDQKFIIEAFADPQTGTVELNQRISEDRATAVYDMLVNVNGVNASQLVKRALGQNNVPHANFRLNRVVVIRPLFDNN